MTLKNAGLLLLVASPGCTYMPQFQWGAEVDEETVSDTGYIDAIDTDGDGLPDWREYQLGSDPEQPDTDGDTYRDGVEFDSFTDPTDADDHPYEGGWPIDACRHDTFGDDTAQDFALIDQFGETVRLHDFCDHVVLLVGCTSWHPVCRDTAAMTQEMSANYRDDGLVVVTLLGEDRVGMPPQLDELETWVDALNLTHPVVADPNLETTYRFVVGNSVGLPSMTLLGRGMEIIIANQWVDDNDIVGALTD